MVKRVFVNFSNHPSHLWNSKQVKAANIYGEIEDIQFPYIDPLMTSHEIKKLAGVYSQMICTLKPVAVLVQGEMTLCFNVIKELKKQNVKVVCACSNRFSNEFFDDEGKVIKESIFQFVQFREY